MFKCGYVPILINGNRSMGDCQASYNAWWQLEFIENKVAEKRFSLKILSIMNDDIEILKDVSLKLVHIKIPFMVTGSMAMNYYIEPRMTRDIDIVLVLKNEDISEILKIFSKDYYIDEHAIEEAVKYNKMFNIIHNNTIVKIDFIIRKQSAYRVLEFERRKKVKILDFETYIVSIEDLILSKLVWMKSSKSEMQKRDIINLLSEDYDKEYLIENSGILAVSELLQEILNVQ